MGCDIHCFSERKQGDSYIMLEQALDVRTYGLFGFLANVRNSSRVPPIISPNRGLPEDISAAVAQEASSWEFDAHNHSYLYLKELNDFDYAQTFENRRFMIQVGENSWNGAATCEKGDGEIISFAGFLGDWFFKELKRINDSGADRIVFWFDN